MAAPRARARDRASAGNAPEQKPCVRTFVALGQSPFPRRRLRAASVLRLATCSATRRILGVIRIHKMSAPAPQLFALAGAFFLFSVPATIRDHYEPPSSFHWRGSGLSRDVAIAEFFVDVEHASPNATALGARGRTLDYRAR